MRRNIFLLLRMVHVSIDHLMDKLFGLRYRQQYIRLSYRLKTAFFPEYGNHIPDARVIGSRPETRTWLPPAIPEWVISEMRELGREIDPAIYPTDQFISSCQYYSFPVIPKPGEIYGELIALCTAESYTHCFAIPWLKRGGADLVSLMHIDFLAKQNNSKVLVMLTEPGESPWLNRIPPNVDVLNVSKYVSHVSHEEILLIITRLIVQLKIGVLHIINSRHVWEVVCKYGLALKQQTNIYASIYCDDYDKFGRPVGFARQYLQDCYRRISMVFSDNSTFPIMLHRTYGFPQEMFTVIKSPLSNLPSVTRIHCATHRRVLWAGRLDRQKRPDLLLAIARRMSDTEFHVYGDSVIEGDNSLLADLRKASNVYLHGAFDGAENLPFHDFPVFLYTSQWDGTPTIILAAAYAEIPIVASAVGGVSDVVTPDSGFPVFDIERVDDYVEKIKYIFEFPDEALQRAKRARSYVNTQHSAEYFEASLKAVPGYLSPCFTQKMD